MGNVLVLQAQYMGSWLLLCGTLTVCAFADSVRTVTERLDVDKDGHADLVIDSVYRGELLVLKTETPPTGSIMRATFAAGRKGFTEFDNNRDGFFELVILARPNDPRPVEAFTRALDGSLTPLSDEALRALERKVLSSFKLGREDKALAGHDASGKSRDDGSVNLTNRPSSESLER